MVDTPYESWLARLSYLFEATSVYKPRAKDENAADYVMRILPKSQRIQSYHAFCEDKTPEQFFETLPHKCSNPCCNKPNTEHICDPCGCDPW